MWIRVGSFSVKPGEADRLKDTYNRLARLKEMRETRLVELTDQGYALTELGRELRSALQPLRQWSERWDRTLARQPVAEEQSR
jgi:DNA-binding HxlR family transcriptional regulator